MAAGRLASLQLLTQALKRRDTLVAEVMASSISRGEVLCALTVLVLTMSLTSHSKMMPKYVQVCKRSDPQYSQCVLRSLESIRPFLAKGIPKLKVPPAEPFVLPSLDVDRDIALLNIKAHFENVTAFGATGFVVDDLEVDPHQLTIKMRVTLPHASVRTHYDVTGRLLVDLSGQGELVGNFTNTKIDIYGIAKEEKVDGRKCMQIDKLSSNIKLGGSYLEFHLKDPTDTIASMAAAFVTQNQQVVLDIAMPIIQDTVDVLAKGIGNSIFRVLPFEEVLPE